MVSSLLNICALFIRKLRMAIKARIIRMLTSIAVSDFKIPLSIATPCSVNANGIYLVPPRLEVGFEVQFCNFVNDWLSVND